MSQEELRPYFDAKFEKTVSRCRRCDAFALIDGWKLDEDKEVWKTPDGYYCISCLQYFVMVEALRQGLFP